MIFYLLLSIFLGFVFAEIVGYAVHVLMHSNKIKKMSEAHMIHHLKLYGPKMPMLSGDYKKSAVKRAHLNGVGLEWLLPMMILTAIILLVLSFAGVPLPYVYGFILAAIAWGVILFAYMHNALHVSDFWMKKNSFLHDWYMSRRVIHFLHHTELSDDGRMNKNYGICFYWLDHIFRTFQKKPRKFNDKGFNAAQKRYDYIYQLKDY